MRFLQAISLSLVFLLVGTITAQAQSYATDRGSFVLGGAVNVSSENVPAVGEEDGRYTSILVNPRVEYFVSSGLAIGGTANLWHTRFDGDGETAYGVGPRVSYFFGRGERTLYPYLSTETSYAAFRGGDRGSLSYAGSAGLLYMLTRAVGLNSAVFYQVQTWTGDDADDPSVHTMGLAVGISAFVF